MTAQLNGNELFKHGESGWYPTHTRRHIRVRTVQVPRFSDGPLQEPQFIRLSSFEQLAPKLYFQTKAAIIGRDEYIYICRKARKNWFMVRPSPKDMTTCTCGIKYNDARNILDAQFSGHHAIK